MRFRLGVTTVALSTVTVAVTGAQANAVAPPLPRLNISAVYVTGVSSGAFMATQLQVADSGTFSGAGIVGGGPYDCIHFNVAGAIACYLGLGTDDLVQSAAALSDAGRIDPVTNLKGKPVYIFHGTQDPVDPTAMSDEGADFYRYFGAQVSYDNTTPAGHGWVTTEGMVPCSLTLPPFLNNCQGVDPRAEMLHAWLGTVNPPANEGQPAGTLAAFDQNQYVPAESAGKIGMDNDGFLYVPPDCAAGTACRLVVALHGCVSDKAYAGDAFPRNANLDDYADTNHLVIVYPQTVPSLAPYDPMGCWDWWGYNVMDPAEQSAPQLVAIMNMVHALGGQRVKTG